MVSPTCAATPVPSVRVVTFSSVGSSAGMETTGLGGTLPVGVVEAMVVVVAAETDLSSSPPPNR